MGNGAESRQPIRVILDEADAQLRGHLRAARARSDHPGIKGSAVEAAVRGVVASCLPPTLVIGQGEVIDSLGSRSRQVDVIISNEHQPFRWGPDESGLYIVEGVSAAGEVKAVLGSKELTDCISKGQRFKRLRNRAHSGASVYGRHEADLKRFYESPPFVVVALETNINVESMLARLADCEQVASLDGIGDPQDPVDAVFLVDRGVALNLGTGQGQDKVLDPDGAPVPGWVFFETVTVLAEMMVWLHRTMPRFAMSSGSPIRNYGTEARSVQYLRPPVARDPN